MSKPKNKQSGGTVTRLHPDLRKQGFLYRAGYGEVLRLDWDDRGLWVCTPAGILLFDAQEGSLLQRLFTPILGVTRDQTGQFYTSAQQIDRWHSDLTLYRSHSPHPGRIEDVAISPDGQTLISLGEAGDLLVADAEGQEVRRLTVAEDACQLQVDWQSRRLWTAGESGAEQWDLDSGERLEQQEDLPVDQTLPGEWSCDPEGCLLWQGSDQEFLVDPPTHWCPDPSGAWLAFANDHELVVVDAVSGELVRSWDEFHEWPLCNAVSPDGRWVLSGGPDGRITQRRTDNGEIKQRYPAHPEAITSLVFANEGRLLFSGAADGGICRWVWPKMEEPELMEGHLGAINQLIVDGQRLFSAGSDGQVIAWDCQSGLQLASLSGYGSSAEQIQVVQRGEILVALYDDGSWASWDVSGYGLD